MSIVITIVSALLLLTLLIVVHEYGHYKAAKKNGIKVAEFAVGFGPRLIKWYRDETEFSIRPIFIGGFVKFADDMEEDAPPKPGDFRTASLKSRFATIIAGPAMNVLVAFIISVVVLTAYGDTAIVVDTVEAGSPAQVAGLMPGDVITDMNGTHIDFGSYDWPAAQRKEQGDSLAITVERDGQSVSYDIPYREELSEAGRKVTGFAVEQAPKSFNFFEAIALSFKWLFMMVGEMLTTLGNLFFLGQGVENLAGIVGTVSIVGTIVQYGVLRDILMITAMISINLAIVNLLPIPALDGGKMVLYAVEGVRKKPAPEKVEGILNLIGMTLVMGLAVFLVFQDITRMVG